MTIHEVAALAGVSIKTVSRVMNGEPYVRAETADRVRSAASELNYRPNMSARNLATERSYQVALWHGLHGGGISSYYITIQNSFVKACMDMAFGPVLDPLDMASQNVIDNALASLAEKRPCGVVLTPPFSDNEELIARLADTNTAFVCLSPSDENTGRSFVATDDKRGARELTEYILDRGHTRIGFISGHPEHGAAMRRLAGFREAHDRRGIPIDDRLVTRGLFTFSSGADTVGKLLSLKDRPTAVFAANDDMAAGVVFRAHEMGLDIPNDLSVAGFDDTAIARYIYPGITTVHQPLDEMIRASVEHLVKRAQKRNGDAPESLSKRFSCRLVVRESVGSRHR